MDLGSRISPSGADQELNLESLLDHRADHLQHRSDRLHHLLLLLCLCPRRVLEVPLGNPIEYALANHRCL